MRPQTLWIALLVLFAAESVAWAQATGPQGITWISTIQEAQGKAKSSGMPILLYVGDKSDTTTELHKSFDDDDIKLILRYFICVYMNPDVSSGPVRDAFHSWIAPGAGTYSPPLITFGTGGGPAQQYRSEGVAVDKTTLKARLNKVLSEQSPVQFRLYKIELVRRAPLKDLLDQLEKSLIQLESVLDKNLVKEYKEEFSWTETLIKHVDPKLDRIKDKSTKKEAKKVSKDLKKKVGSLGTFRGRKIEKYIPLLEEATALIEKLRDYQEPGGD